MTKSLKITDKFWSSITTISGGTGLAQVIGVLSTPIITRIYNPADFGTLTLILSVVGILSTLSSLRYEAAITIEKNVDLVASLVQLSILLTFGYCCLLYLGVFLFPNFVILLFPAFDSVKGHLIVPFLVLITSLTRILMQWIVREKYFKVLSLTKVIQSVTALLVKLGLGYLSFGFKGLLLAHFTLEFSGLIAFARRLKTSNLLASRKKRERSSLLVVLFKYKRFPQFQIWSQLALSLGKRLPVIFLASLFSESIVGAFGFALSILSMPLNLLGESIGQVYLAEISEFGVGNVNKIYVLTKRLLQRLFLFALLPLIICLFFGDSLFLFAFGRKWLLAGEVAMALSMLVFAQFFSTPIMSIFNLFQRQDIQLKLNLLRLLCVVLWYFIIASGEFTLIHSIWILSCLLSITYVLSVYAAFGVLRTQPELT